MHEDISIVCKIRYVYNWKNLVSVLFGDSLLSGRSQLSRARYFGDLLEVRTFWRYFRGVATMGTLRYVLVGEYQLQATQNATKRRTLY